MKRADSVVTYKYGRGTAFVKGDIFSYRGNFRGQLNFYVKDIQEVSLNGFKSMYIIVYIPFLHRC